MFILNFGLSVIWQLQHGLYNSSQGIVLKQHSTILVSLNHSIPPDCMVAISFSRHVSWNTTHYSYWIISLQIDVMYLGSRAKDTLSFVNTFSDRTDITFAADKSQVACSGRVQNGKVLSNLCGQNGLPQYGTSSSPLVITSVSDLMLLSQVHYEGLPSHVHYKGVSILGQMYLLGQNGKVLSNLCGQNGLPQYGTSSSPLVITSVSDFNVTKSGSL